MRRRGRLLILLVTAGLAAAVLAAWTQTWLTVALALEGEEPLTVSGQSAAPALTALALASLALVAALTIAGRVFRLVLGILQIALGGCVLLSAMLVLLDPAAAAASSITETTGVAGTDSLARLVTGTELSPWPWLTAVLGVFMAAAGLVVLVTGSHWPGPSRRYDAVRLSEAPVAEGTGAPAAPNDAIADWDDLSRGDDPTRDDDDTR